jgi:hemerythrin superfamily protein
MLHGLHARIGVPQHPPQGKGKSMEKATTSTSARKGAKTQPQDAIAILSADHKNVKAMFKQYEDLKEDGDSEEKAALAARICLELTVHAQAEEEIFYPAVREAIEDDDLMDEAEVEHASAKDLIAQLSEADPEDDLFDAKVKVLGEYINHHVEEEEGEMFPKAKKAKVDMAALGAEIESRKEELMAEFEGESEAPEEPKTRGRSSR